MAPKALLVGESVYNAGTILLLLLFFCVFLGMRFVSIVAAVSLSCVILSIISIYIGIFASGSTPSMK